MSRYPSPLGLYFYNILIYAALVGYEGPETLITSKDLSSALLDPIKLIPNSVTIWTLSESK